MSFRKALIRLGKALPFIVCFLICLNYAETAFALATSNFLCYDGVVIPNTPISFFVGRYFEYNAMMLFVLVVISIAIETCVFNKLACLYLLVNLLEKSFFDFEIEPAWVYIICVSNMIISGYLTYKGVKVIIKVK